jgi:hypothetical protein
VKGSVDIKFPVRKSDATGQRPSWFPFGFNSRADDNDAADPIPLTPREKTIGERKPIPWLPR